MLELLCMYIQIIAKAKIYSMAEMLSKQNMLTDRPTDNGGSNVM